MSHLLEDKLARECALATNIVTSTMEPISVAFSELEMNDPLPMSFSTRKRAVVDSKEKSFLNDTLNDLDPK